MDFGKHLHRRRERKHLSLLLAEHVAEALLQYLQVHRPIFQEHQTQNQIYHVSMHHCIKCCTIVYVVYFSRMKTLEGSFAF